MNPGSPILETWATFLQEESMAFLGIENMLDMTKGVQYFLVMLQNQVMERIWYDWTM